MINEKFNAFNALHVSGDLHVATMLHVSFLATSCLTSSIPSPLEHPVIKIFATLNIDMFLISVNRNLHKKPQHQNQNINFEPRMLKVQTGVLFRLFLYHRNSIFKPLDWHGHVVRF